MMIRELLSSTLKYKSEASDKLGVLNITRFKLLIENGAAKHNPELMTKLRLNWPYQETAELLRSWK